MPFEEDTRPPINDRAERDAQFTVPNPSAGELVGAALQADNTIVNLANDIVDFGMNDFEDDPDYDPIEDMAGYEGWANDLVHSKSREEMTMRKQRIDDDLQNRETLASASGTAGFLAQAAGEIVEPLNYIPIGGQAYKTYRTGGNILEGAAKTAAVAAIVETGREAYLQTTQAVRTKEEAYTNIASATVLSGILGGVASTLSPAQKADLDLKISEDMQIPNNSLSSAGAMQVGTTAEQELIKGLDKTQKLFKKIPGALTNPVYRGSTSESKTVRQVTEQLADTSLIKNKNADFIASATSVENKIKGYDRLKLQFYNDFNPQYQAYLKSVKAQKKAGGIPEDQKLGSKRDGSLTFKEFGEHVTRAGRRNDTHIIPEVQTVAQSVRRNVYDPLKQRMVDTGLLDDLDIDVKTADSWVRRMWDKDKILANRAEFHARNLDWLKKKFDVDVKRLAELEKLKSTDAKVLKEIEKLKFKTNMASPELELSSIADQIIDRITGLPGGRLGYDIKLEGKQKGKPKAGARGSAKARVYDIPDELVEDYLVNDVHAIVESHVRTTAADAELKDTFGTLDFDVVRQSVQEDYARMIAAAKGDTKKVAQLEKAKRNDMSDLEAMYDKLRGTYAQPDDYAAPQHVAERALLAWNYTRLLGGMTLSAIPDMGRHVIVHGIQRTMNDGVLAMMTDWKGFKAATKDLREAAVGLDMALSTTALARANIDEFTPAAGKVDAVSQAVTGGFQAGPARIPSFGSITLMNQWNTGQKTFAGILTQTRMMKAIKEVGAGKTLTKKEIENLAGHGIDKDMAQRIAKEFKKHGQTREKVLVPNAREWTDSVAAETFRAAVRKQVDETIVTPGLDRPLWMSRAGWRLVGQFRSFSMASMQRVTMAGIQQADAAALNGVLMMAAMGSMVYAAKTTLAGREVSDDPRVWITEGIDRSGLTGWFFDVNNITEKATRGTVGVNALIGGPQMSRYASRNVVSSIAGPTFGLGQDFFQLTGAGFSGEWAESDSHAMRRLLPYQNVLYLRNAFDEMESGLNNKLGVTQ